MNDYKQVCKSCGSEEVARCKWVNVNTEKIYDADSGTTLEWCFNCNNETYIIDKAEFIDSDMEDKYIEFLEDNYEYIKGVQSKYSYYGGNSLSMAIGEVKEEYKDELSHINFENIRESEIEDFVFRGVGLPKLN